MVADLGWVDYDLGHSVVCLVLHDQMWIWQNRLGNWAKWWNIPNPSQRNPEGWFLKKYFWENLAAVLRRTATLPGNFWENCGAVLMRTNIEISWWFLKWVLMRNSVRFLGRTCIRGGSYENQRVWENQAAVLMRTNPINQWWFLNEVLPANGGSYKNHSAVLRENRI